ncbi:hypothetical protein ABKN59_001480 [Abortiporus biennis]
MWRVIAHQWDPFQLLTGQFSCSFQKPIKHVYSQYQPRRRTSFILGFDGCLEPKNSIRHPFLDNDRHRSQTNKNNIAQSPVNDKVSTDV